jgi:hypothetical protein
MSHLTPPQHCKAHSLASFLGKVDSTVITGVGCGVLRTRAWPHRPAGRGVAMTHGLQTWCCCLLAEVGPQSSGLGAATSTPHLKLQKTSSQFGATCMDLTTAICLSLTSLHPRTVGGLLDSSLPSRLRADLEQGPGS